jgi:hypothetical protein
MPGPQEDPHQQGPSWERGPSTNVSSGDQTRLGRSLSKQVGWVVAEESRCLEDGYRHWSLVVKVPAALFR